MAFSFAVAVAFLLSLAVVVQSALGDGLVCEQLPPDVCAFAVSSEGRRCVLESTAKGARRCQTSAVAARALSGWVETDECARACGVDRAVLGLPIASAAAEDHRFVRALCSPACHGGCPNIVDLYATVAAGEGTSLAALCEAHKNVGSRRMMAGMSPVGAPVGAPAPM